MRQSAIIFGGIGTLVETSNIQRLAFNNAFEKLGIDFEWDVDSYRDSLAGTGGQHRLAGLVIHGGTRLSPSQIKQIHALKTENYVNRLSTTHLDVRPGVSELIDHARQHDIKLAWATTTSVANIDAVVQSTNGALDYKMFDFIGNDTTVTHQKPDPQIYSLCLKALSMDAGAAIAIEDGLMGIKAAQAAGISTIAFPGEFQMSKDFHLADRTVSNLASLIEVPSS